MPAQHRHAPGIAAHSMVFDTAATGSDLSLVSFDTGKSGVRCAPAGSHDGNGSPPCRHDNCPCCPLVHFAIGVLPLEPARVAYAPLLSRAIAPPALLGSLTRPVALDGRPRAPPILV